MRITFVIETANMSGGIRVVAIYAKALAQMGHTVCVVSTPPRQSSLARKLKSWLRGRGWPPYQAPQKTYLDDPDIDHRILDHWRPITDDDVPDADVVIATWWETAEWVNALSAKKGSKAYFVQGHEIFPHLPVERSRATYRLPLHKIVVAQWLKDVMSKEYGDNVVDLVPNSVDRSQFYALARGKQKSPTVGFLYAAAPLKGVDLVLEVLRHVRNQFPDLRIISFGTHRPTPELALPPDAEFFLLPPQDEIRNLYSQCDVWITASQSEGFNLPAMEAMSCRTPVVATGTGWPAEAVKTGRNGVLVDINDRSALAQGVEWVLSRSDLEWRELSANAYATAAVGSWQESVKMFEESLERARRRSSNGEVGGV
jgi:glycosyltransferase involved in cell wall biosynthesis